METGINRTRKNDNGNILYVHYSKMQSIVNVDKRYERRMCKDCKFYKDKCTKNRKATICAKKGLKNRE